MANDAQVEALVDEALNDRSDRRQDRPKEHALAHSVHVNQVVAWEREQDEHSLIDKRQSVDDCCVLVVARLDLLGYWLQADPGYLSHDTRETVKSQFEPSISVENVLRVLRIGAASLLGDHVRVYMGFRVHFNIIL